MSGSPIHSILGVKIRSRKSQMGRLESECSLIRAAMAVQPPELLDQQSTSSRKSQREIQGFSGRPVQVKPMRLGYEAWGETDAVRDAPAVVSRGKLLQFPMCRDK